MSVTPSPIGGFAAQFFDNNGVILSGGKIFTYAAGTTTPQASYTSASGVTPHSNPIILDSAGRVPGGEIWLTDGLVYKFVIETATGILLGTYDNITGVNSNFVNYTIQEEVITATAGQTVFNLSTINYTPGTNSLSVYIDGVNQYVGDSYLETDSNTVTFTAGLHVGAEVKFTTAVQSTSGAVDASIVSYDPPFIGSVVTTVEDKLAQYVSVKDFGAVGDGVADDTAKIQAAINYMAPIGGTILFPAGTYKVTSSLNWVQTADVGAAGIMFQGEGGTGGPLGGATTIIKSYIANGPLFQIQGTASSGGGASGSKFYNGGGMSGICLDGANATGTSQGIRVSGWQYADISDVTIMNFPGDGVTQYTDPGYPNGDYSSSTMNFIDCWIWNNKGNGINQTGYIGAFLWQFNKTLFGYCGNGAVITSSNNSFIDCSFVGCGFSETGTVLAGGISIKAGTATGSINRMNIKGCEFDFARVAHITLDYIQTTTISTTRFIFNDRNATGAMTPPTGINIAPSGAASNIASIDIANCNMRIDTVGVLTGFLLSNISNVTAIAISDIVWSDNTGGAATITKYGGFTNSNRNLRSGYRIIEDQGVVIPGKPTPFVAMKTTAGQSISNATFGTVVFGTQDTVNAQIYPAGTTAGVIYNTTTGVFTAPQTGFYSVNATLNIAGMTASDTARTQIVTSSTGTFSADVLGAVTSSGILGVNVPNVTVFCAAGDTIEVKASIAGTSRSLSTNSSYPSVLNIAMMS
jgi:hypothetical protein